jgi:hypothetical protein
MASPHEISRALRAQFGAVENTVLLSEILNFLDSYQKSREKADAANLQQPHTPRTTTPAAATAVTCANAYADTRQGEQQQQQQDQATEHVSNHVTETLNQSASKTGSQRESQSNIQPNKQSYATVAKKAATQAPPSGKRPTRPNHLPKSLQNRPKEPKPQAIKISLRKPLNTPIIDLIDKTRAKSLIKALKVITKRQLLVFPRDEKAKESLQNTAYWLEELDADLYARNYSIVAYDVDRDLGVDRIKNKFQEQNPQVLRGVYIDVHSIGKPIGKGPIRIDLKCPILANRLIHEGLVLDYEFKAIRQYRPRIPERKSTQKREKAFYKEKGAYLPESLVFKANPTTTAPDIGSQTPYNPQNSEQMEWTLIEGTQKRKMAQITRGRPRRFARRDSSDGDIQLFLTPQEQKERPTTPTNECTIDSSE